MSAEHVSDCVRGEARRDAGRDAVGCFGGLLLSDGDWNDDGLGRQVGARERDRKSTILLLFALGNPSGCFVLVNCGLKIGRSRDFFLFEQILC